MPLVRIFDAERMAGRKPAPFSKERCDQLEPLRRDTRTGANVAQFIETLGASDRHGFDKYCEWAERDCFDKYLLY
jgi:hypothetical protein